ncbi:hypothetical protein Tco_0224465, partial [Tanacetum coccineum]
MLKNFDIYDLEKLWELVKERFNITEPTDDKERELWVDLKRLFKPNTYDLMELQKHMHDPLTWRLYDTCGVHHVETKTGLDMFMLIEKDYPLTRGLSMLMLINKLQVDQQSKMEKELVQTRSFDSEETDLMVNHKFRGGLLGFRASTLSTVS